ncbi:hypothetical protein C8J57DRAFT_1336159 [Mycena rebaudengoi]|nr:hypothetical protein C8J57DRAFT_1378184 [Mycena rebaudengoi]KAJ7262096.1 hypothetical protein C8J57DRAFT_1336159 [Mycena rebaudengoi]
MHIEPCLVFDSSTHGPLACGTPVHSIIAVVLVFKEAPSPLQVGHVLDLTWSEVREYLLPVAEFLEPPGLPEHYYSNFRISRNLRNLLIDPSHPETFVDLRKWHAFVALWCLTRSSLNYDARDIFYAGEYWAHHICCSRPSPQLWSALKRSHLPFRLTSRSVLPYVIGWLKKVDVDDTQELAAAFNNFYSRTQAAIASGLSLQVMGGMVSIELK